jgi:hypothetical protein
MIRADVPAAPTMATTQPVTFYVPQTSVEPIEVGVAHSGLRMVLVSRDAVHRLGDDWAVLGVYFLLGPATDPDRYRAYVGEVGRRTLLLRLKEHAKQKEWWSRALLIASASDDFNSAEIGWLEGRLFDVLNNALAADVENRGRPGDDSIAERDRGVLERYIEPIMAALRASGAPPDTADQQAPPSGRRRPPTRYTESVRDLIEARLLKPGTRLQPLRRNLTKTALVCESGDLEVDGTLYAAVSPAAIAVSGSKTEAGWDFWGAPSGDGTYVALSKLRARLREQGVHVGRRDPEATADAAPTRRPDEGSSPPRMPEARAARGNGQAKARPDGGTHGSRYAVGMPELLAAGALTAGEELVAMHRGRELRTVLLPNGNARGLDGKADKSVSMVAKDAIGRNVNGWDFWSVERDARPVRLAKIRAEYLKVADATPARIPREPSSP